MATLKELMAKQSPESQVRIAAKVEEMRQTIALHQLREELNISQTEWWQRWALSNRLLQKWSRQITILGCLR